MTITKAKKVIGKSKDVEPFSDESNYSNTSVDVLTDGVYIHYKKLRIDNSLKLHISLVCDFTGSVKNRLAPHLTEKLLKNFNTTIDLVSGLLVRKIRKFIESSRLENNKPLGVLILKLTTSDHFKFFWNVYLGDNHKTVFENIISKISDIVSKATGGYFMALGDSEVPIGYSDKTGIEQTFIDPSIANQDDDIPDYRPTESIPEDYYAS
jgi:hypothetical protein